jgi:DDE superfamily endonuclease
VKVAGVREAIEAAGATLRYLPAYSPDLNPIEQAFSKLGCGAHRDEALETDRKARQDIGAGGVC